MDNQPRPPVGGNGQTPNNKPTGPAPLDKFDFDKDLDATPAVPGPLLHQQVAGKPTNKGKTLVMILLTVLLLAAVAAAGYFYWQTMQTQNQVNQKQSQVESLTAENGRLKSDVAKAGDIEPVASPSDSEQVKIAAVKYVCAGMSTTCDDLKAETPKIEGDSAKVSTSDTLAGMAVYLKRVKVGAITEWVAFFSTQNGISKAMVEKYSFPASLLGPGEVKDN